MVDCRKKIKMIDLHTHSLFSDGSNTPEELVTLAEEANLTTLALTDHDTIDGLARFLKAGENSSVRTVNGVELSAEYDGKTLHILGYDFDPSNQAFQDALAWIRAGRAERNIQILKKLNALGYDLTYEEIRKYSGNGLIGRPHFAMALIDRGHFKPKAIARHNNKNEAQEKLLQVNWKKIAKNKIFNQLLGKNCAAYVDRRRLIPEQCIELIHEAGGISVIAHPGQIKLTRNKLRQLVKKLKGMGLDGLEVYYPAHSSHQIQILERLCKEFDFVATGGSDFHGTFTSDPLIGTDIGIADFV